MRSTQSVPFQSERSDRQPLAPRPVLVLAWSREEPERVGELVPLPEGRATLGRAVPAPGGSPPAVGLERWRPGREEPTGGLASPHVSRVQWELEARADGSLFVANRGRAGLRVGGRSCDEGVAWPGDLVEMTGLALFRYTARAPIPRSDPPVQLHAFGEPDADGLVGETPAAWALRARLAFVGPRDVHVLVLGPSGTGKELVARAVHRRSGRARGPFVARNAATIPEGLVDAELFGNVRNYPNVGMPDRPGTIGEAEGGTLLLDEIGELPVALQTHLLRVLDSGEYTRLGEGRTRQASFRLVGATNRPPEVLRDDVRARMPLTVEVPPLADRLDDVPLLARHLLRRIQASDPAAVQRFVDGSGAPRMSSALVEALLAHPWQTHLRELQALLWRAIADSPGPLLEPPAPKVPPPPAARPQRDPGELSAEEVQAALDRHDGNQEETWRALGLSSRHVLGRLVRRYGLRVRGRTGRTDDEGEE